MSMDRKQLIGSWDTEPVDFGSMSDEILVLMPDGRGTHIEMGCGFECYTPSKWTLEGGKLHVFTDDFSRINSPVTVSDSPVEVTDIAHNLHHFVEMKTDVGTWYKTSDDPRKTLTHLAGLFHCVPNDLLEKRIEEL
jgi:hypothetical protein